jgi:exodeoxyribonuclease VII large subunit
VTGIGHETDTTIADFVADLRAPTPSAAAAAVTPDGPALRARLQSLDRRRGRGIDNGLNRQAQTLDYLARRLAQHQPGRRLDELAKRLDELLTRLLRCQQAGLDRQQRRLQAADQRLGGRHPDRQIQRARTAAGQLDQRLLRSQRLLLERSGTRLENAVRQLNAVSPLKVLERGYAVIRDEQGQALTREEGFASGNKINILMNNFEVDAEIRSEPRPARLP